MAGSINRLTATRVKNATKPGWYSDGGGLYLRVQSPTQRSWVYLKTKNGKRTERGIGSANTMTLAQARAALNAPKTSTKETPTFGACATAYMDAKQGEWSNAKHREQWTHSLEVHAKHIYDLPVDAVTTEDVLVALRTIWNKYPETAQRLRGRIERVLNSARAAGHIGSPYENPARWAGHLEFSLPHFDSKNAAHHEAVHYRDVPKFWKRLCAKPPTSSALALRFTILTAARTGETIGATWKEIDLEAKLWTIPGERMKMGFEHTVPLSDAAVAILSVLAVAGMKPDDFVFPGQKDGAGLSNMAMLGLMRKRLGMTETVHGFRSTFRDWAGSATNYARELAEEALAHAIGDKVERAYRREQAIEKRRPMMQDWADYLRGGSPPPATE